MNIKQSEFSSTQKKVDELLSKDAKQKGQLLFDEREISFSLEENNSFLGGITGKINGCSLHITGLAVAENVRAKGVGTKLLQEIEHYAKNENLVTITLSTLSYQALPFYQKQGYSVLGHVENVPQFGVTKYYLGKNLQDEK